MTIAAPNHPSSSPRLASTIGDRMEPMTSGFDEVVAHLRTKLAPLQPSTSADYRDIDAFYLELRERRLPAALDASGLAEQALVEALVQLFTPDITLARQATAATRRWFERLAAANPGRRASELAVDALVVACFAGDAGLLGPNDVDVVESIRRWAVPRRIAESVVAHRLAASAGALQDLTDRQVIASWEARSQRELRAMYSNAAMQYVYWQQGHRCGCHVCVTSPNARHLVSRWMPGSSEPVTYGDGTNDPVLRSAGGARSPSRTLEHWVDTWLVGARSERNPTSSDEPRTALQVNAVREGVFFRHFLARVADPPWILRVGEVLREVCAEPGCEHNQPGGRVHRATSKDQGTKGPVDERYCPADPSHPLRFSTVKRLRDFVFLPNPNLARHVDFSLHASAPRSHNRDELRPSHAFYGGLKLDKQADTVQVHWAGRESRWIAQPSLEPAWSTVLRESERNFRQHDLAWVAPEPAVPPDPRFDDAEADVTDEDNGRGTTERQRFTFTNAEVDLGEHCRTSTTTLLDFIACLEANGGLRSCTPHCPCSGEKPYCEAQLLALVQRIEERRNKRRKRND